MDHYKQRPASVSHTLSQHAKPASECHSPSATIGALTSTEWVQHVGGKEEESEDGKAPSCGVGVEGFVSNLSSASSDREHRRAEPWRPRHGGSPVAAVRIARPRGGSAADASRARRLTTIVGRGARAAARARRRRVSGRTATLRRGAPKPRPAERQGHCQGHEAGCSGHGGGRTSPSVASPPSARPSARRCPSS